MLPPDYETVTFVRLVGSRPSDDPIGLQFGGAGRCHFFAMPRAELQRLAEVILHRLSAEYDAEFAARALEFKAEFLERERYASQSPRSSEMSSAEGSQVDGQAQAPETRSSSA